MMGAGAATQGRGTRGPAGWGRARTRLRSTSAACSAMMAWVCALSCSSCGGRGRRVMRVLLRRRQQTEPNREKKKLRVLNASACVGGRDGLGRVPPPGERESAPSGCARLLASPLLGQPPVRVAASPQGQPARLRTCKERYRKVTFASPECSVSLRGGTAGARGGERRGWRRKAHCRFAAAARSASRAASSVRFRASLASCSCRARSASSRRFRTRSASSARALATWEKVSRGHACGFGLDVD